MGKRGGVSANQKEMALSCSESFSSKNKKRLFVCFVGSLSLSCSESFSSACPCRNHCASPSAVAENCAHVPRAHVPHRPWLTGLFTAPRATQSSGPAARASATASAEKGVCCGASEGESGPPRPRRDQSTSRRRSLPSAKPNATLSTADTPLIMLRQSTRENTSVPRVTPARKEDNLLPYARKHTGARPCWPSR